MSPSSPTRASAPMGGGSSQPARLPRACGRHATEACCSSCAGTRRPCGRRSSRATGAGSSRAGRSTEPCSATGAVSAARRPSSCAWRRPASPPSTGRTKQPPGATTPRLLELVCLAGQRGEAGLQPVVRSGGRERPGQEPTEAGREDARRRQTGGGPGPAATAARHELADRLAEVAGLDRLLTALVCAALYERISEEAGDLVARQRPRRLERRQREHGEVEGRVARGVAAEPP